MTAFGLQGSFFEPPYSEPTTSREASRSARQRAPIQREAVYAWIAGCGAAGSTADEVEVGLEMRSNSVGPRIWELCGNKGHPVRVIKTEARRPTRSGCAARVYMALRV